MASTTEKPAATSAAYERPAIADHGSLQDLTADFHLEFVGSALKLVTMAVVSGPLVGGGDSPSGDTSMTSPPLLTDAGTPLTPDTTPHIRVPDSGVLGGGPTSGGSHDTWAAGLSSPGGHLPGGAHSPGGTGGVREELPGAAAGLPFTGYAAWASAAVGAAMTTSGVILRDMLRRHR